MYIAHKYESYNDKILINLQFNIFLYIEGQIKINFYLPKYSGIRRNGSYKAHKNT